MNIVLIGYRGTGKTVIGKKLSQKLGWPCIALDELIVQKKGLSIRKIVKSHGWEYFRDLESKVVEEVAQKDNAIIDTGGGVILRQQNTNLLKKNGLLFWLKADPETIIDRIKDDESRPSLTEGRSFLEEVRLVLHQRLSLYKAAGDFIVETAGKSIDSIAEEIISMYNMKKNFAREISSDE